MQPSSIDSFLASPLGLASFAILFAPLWCANCFYVSFVSGWLTLSRRFRKQSEPHGEIKTTRPAFSLIFMRFWSHYGSVIQVFAAQDALYALVFFLFRIGHPPLRIPWDEIRITRIKLLLCKIVRFTLGKQEQIAMRISERMARNLGILDRVPA